MKAAASVLIKNTVSETFEAFTDYENRDKYLPHVKKLKFETLHRNGRGVVWYEEREINGVLAKGKIEVSVYTKPKALVLTTHSEGLIFKTRYNFQYAGERATKVVCTIGGKPKGILAWVMDKFLNRNSEYLGQLLQIELDSYKEKIEKSK